MSKPSGSGKKVVDGWRGVGTNAASYAAVIGSSAFKSVSRGPLEQRNPFSPLLLLSTSKY